MERSGQTGIAVRMEDWSGTSLGGPQEWPGELFTLAGVMLTSAQPMFLAWGPERLLLYNAAYTSILGDRHPSALGRPFFDAWPQARDDVGRQFDQVFKGIPVHIDAIELALDCPGKPREAHFSFSYSPVYDRAGGVQGVFCACNEITDQVFARRREGLLDFRNRLFETLRALVHPVDIQSEASRLLGMYLGANRVVYFEICGDEYVIERDFVTNVRPLAGRYLVSSFGAELLASLRAGRTVVETDATTESGRPAEARASFAAIEVRGHVDVPLIKGREFVAGMTVHCSDARDWNPDEVALIEDTAERTWAAVQRARAAAALHTSEERFAFVRRSSGVGFWYCDLPFDVLEWDELVKRHFHLEADAVVTIDTFYERIHPDDREPTRAAIAQSIDGHSHYDTVYRTVHPTTGAVRWVRAIGRTFYQADGTPSRFDGLTLDVTEQKLAEATLREADRHKDEFLATLAHELRNPLAPLRNGLQVLRIGASDAAVVGRAREMMERQVDVMVRLVDDLLDVARISGGKVELQRQPQSLQTVVARAVETAMPAIEAHRHTLTVNAAAQPITVDIDGARMTQVLANLIGNAAKYTAPGGLLTVEASIEGNEAVASVSDNGVGISEDALHRVFDMFAQVGDTRSMAQGGLGIGLFLSKKLIDLHGGRLVAESAGPGKGSTFTVRLPLAANASSLPDLAAAPGEARPIRPLRILVVDDNLDAGDSLALRLSLDGHQTRVARDGTGGLKAAREFIPDVAFVDIGMPGMNGYDLARALRADPIARGSFLVALTGWGAEADIEQARAAGFDKHLTKPASASEIQAALSSVDAQALRP